MKHVKGFFAGFCVAGAFVIPTVPLWLFMGFDDPHFFVGLFGSYGVMVGFLGAMRGWTCLDDFFGRTDPEPTERDESERPVLIVGNGGQGKGHFEFDEHNMPDAAMQIANEFQEAEEVRGRDFPDETHDLATGKTLDNAVLVRVKLLRALCDEIAAAATEAKSGR